jgi:hypothetical protein
LKNLHLNQEVDEKLNRTSHEFTPPYSTETKELSLQERIKRWMGNHSFVEESLSLDMQISLFGNKDMTRILPLSTESNKEIMNLASLYLYPPLMKETLGKPKLPPILCF